MFDRFTDRARRAMGESRRAAQQLENDHIGTEHLLLGVIEVSNGVAAAVFKNLKVDTAKLKERAIALAPEPNAEIGFEGQLPFTPRAKNALNYALHEAVELGHTYLGTAHLVLGLLRESKGAAYQALSETGIHVDRARQEVRQLLSSEASIGVDETAPHADGDTQEAHESRSHHHELQQILRQERRLTDSFGDGFPKVIAEARKAARRFRHEYLCTEHLLLGIAKCKSAVGRDILKHCGIAARDVSKHLRHIELQPPDKLGIDEIEFSADDPIGYTVRAANACRFAHEEAENWSLADPSTAHLLLGLIIDRRSSAAKALNDLGMPVGDIRREIAATLYGHSTPSADETSATDSKEKLKAMEDRLASMLGALEVRILTLEDQLRSHGKEIADLRKQLRKHDEDNAPTTDE